MDQPIRLRDYADEAARMSRFLAHSYSTARTNGGYWYAPSQWLATREGRTYVVINRGYNNRYRLRWITL
jgi:hypothetical protein